MPASRIAFALSDLRNEIERLMPLDSTFRIEVKLSPDAYRRATDELAHHYGVELKREAIQGALGTGESVRIGGITISTMLSGPGSG